MTTMRVGANGTGFETRTRSALAVSCGISRDAIGAWSVSMNVPSGRYLSHTVGRFQASRTLKMDLRVMTSPEESTRIAREKVAVELPDDPLGVAHWVRTSPFAEYTLMRQLPVSQSNSRSSFVSANPDTERNSPGPAPLRPMFRTNLPDAS